MFSKTSCNGHSDPKQPSSQKKLVIHFDIRNTMIVADSVTNITVEQALNAYLTGVLWGKEVDNIENSWEWASTEPTLLSPAKDTTTFYKHLEKMMVKTPLDRVALRLAVGDFTHTQIGSDFFPYFNDHLKLLEWPYKDTNPLITLCGQNGGNYHYVLPSVYKLIQHLHDVKREFTLIIRTYGLDCQNVLNSLNWCITTKKHPQFPNLPDMPLHPYAGRILRNEEEISLQVFDKEKVIKELKDETEIYKFMSGLEGINGFKDDFLYWQNNGYHHKCAKPLWIDGNDTSCQHILFDDNYRINDTDSIVDVRTKDSDGNWRSLEGEDLKRLDNVSLVQVDLLKAIADDNYFVKKVRDCEKNYETMQVK